MSGSKGWVAREFHALAPGLLSYLALAYVTYSVTNHVATSIFFPLGALFLTVVLITYVARIVSSASVGRLLVNTLLHFIPAILLALQFVCLWNTSDSCLPIRNNGLLYILSMCGAFMFWAFPLE